MSRYCYVQLGYPEPDNPAITRDVRRNSWSVSKNFRISIQSSVSIWSSHWKKLSGPHSSCKHESIILPAYATCEDDSLLHFCPLGCRVGMLAAGQAAYRTAAKWRLWRPPSQEYLTDGCLTRKNSTKITSVKSILCLNFWLPTSLKAGSCRWCLRLDQRRNWWGLASPSIHHLSNSSFPLSAHVSHAMSGTLPGYYRDQLSGKLPTSWGWAGPSSVQAWFRAGQLLVGLSTEVLSFYLGDLDTSVGPGTSLWVGSVSWAVNSNRMKLLRSQKWSK